MSHVLDWYTPHQVMYLHVFDNPSQEELQAINDEVLNALDHLNTPVGLVLDVTGLSTGYMTAYRLRNTQLYMNDNRLERAYIVAEDKLNRLITLIAFNIARVPFVQFDNFDKAEMHLSKRGYASVLGR
ncbi:MAG: hypothetical protein OHK0046_19500 [Anaerolineae bacterium]